MRSWVSLGLVVATMAVWGMGPLDAQEALTKTDRQGPVSVTVTLTAPPTVGTPITVTVALDTHSVALDPIASTRPWP